MAAAAYHMHCVQIRWTCSPSGQSEYKFLVDMQDMNPEYILDVGGVGMSAIWLSLLFPAARILRMDPNPDNFAVGL